MSALGHRLRPALSLDGPSGRALGAVGAALIATLAVWILWDPPALALLYIAVGAAGVAAVRGLEDRPFMVLRGLAAATLFYGVIESWFNPPLDIFLFGASAGALYGLLAVGIILVYRTSRIINFAAAALGAIPAIAAVLLVVEKHWNYWVTVPIALVGAMALGAFVDFAIIRRFSTAPRLILTVATIGISQILAFLTIKTAIGLGTEGELKSAIPTPWKNAFEWRGSNGRILLSGDHIFALLMVFAVGIGLAMFFRFSRIGIALRASAENADRASLLGIPVKRVQTVAWALAGLLAGLAIFLRAPLIGVPTDGSLGYSVLVYALAAAVIAKMDDTIVAIFAGMAVGVIEQASVIRTGANNLATAVMLFVILASLLLQRKSLSRALDAGTSTWQSVKEFRGVPTELRAVREVVLAKYVLYGVVVALFVAAPWIVGDAKVDKLTQLPLDAIVAISLVILTGWAGQISLGQFALVGVGAGVAGGMVANHNIDFFAAVLLAALVGAATAFVLGLPALRVQGLYLAVATLAFAAASEGYILRPDELGRHFLPEGQATRVERPILWERVDVTSKHSFYFLCLIFLLAAILAARSFRKNRSGRVLIAVRDNQRAAPAYAINLARNKLAAFAISGALAAVAGLLIAYQSGSVDYQAYGMTASVSVFVYTVVGGLTSVGGGVAGAVVFGVIRLFGEDIVEGLSFLATGVGVLVVLLFLPGGLAEAFYKTRDNFLKWVAKRHDILVPSLLADKRVEEEERKAQDEIIEAAEQHVEEVESFDLATEPTILCPVCELVLTLDEAPNHDHLRAGGQDPEPVAMTGGGASRLSSAREGRR